MKLLITGGAGFIGSALIRSLIKHTDDIVCNVDKLTYAGNIQALDCVKDNPRYFFEQVDICTEVELTRIFAHFQPDAVLHLAAESHVDRSISGSQAFIQTNIVGTYVLLEVARRYWLTLAEEQKKPFRFLHISTDEVYGSLAEDSPPFQETSVYAPSSPYSASKASADHLVAAWHRTYGLPTLITNCSNNYGPYQYPEKLIPLMISHALSGKILPLYGNGRQIRDWLYVEDHVQALISVLKCGVVGQTYNIGGDTEKRNIEVVQTICSLLEELAPEKPAGIVRYQDLIRFTEDRPGHDTRYAIDATKIRRELDWKPQETFETGMRKTVIWYYELRKRKAAVAGANAGVHGNER